MYVQNVGGLPKEVNSALRNRKKLPGRFWRILPEKSVLIEENHMQIAVKYQLHRLFKNGHALLLQ